MSKREFFSEDSSMLAALETAGKANPGVWVGSSPGEKIVYSGRLSAEIAATISNELKAHKLFSSAESGEKPVVSGTGGRKKTDVRISDEVNGLIMAISIKTTSFRDLEGRKKVKDYNHNLDRFDNEFRSEAAEIHLRQPFEIMVGLFFLPVDAIVPRVSSNASGFARWVRKLRARSGRASHLDSPDRFERMFIGLFADKGDRRGRIRFFDVNEEPPTFGFPSSEKMLDGAALLKEIEQIYFSRNPRPASFGPAGPFSHEFFGQIPQTIDDLGFPDGCLTKEASEKN